MYARCLTSWGHSTQTGEDLITSRGVPAGESQTGLPALASTTLLPPSASANPLGTERCAACSLTPGVSPSASPLAPASLCVLTAWLCRHRVCQSFFALPSHIPLPFSPRYSTIPSLRPDPPLPVLPTELATPARDDTRLDSAAHGAPAPSVCAGEESLQAARAGTSDVHGCRSPLCTAYPPCERAGTLVSPMAARPTAQRLRQRPSQRFQCRAKARLRTSWGRSTRTQARQSRGRLWTAFSSSSTCFACWTLLWRWPSRALHQPIMPAAAR